MDKNSVQIGLIGLVVGVIAVGYVGELDKPKLKPIIAVSSSASDIEVDSLIKDLSKENKETLYKIMKGVSSYSKNSKRIRKVYVVSDIVAEVYLNYKMENFTQLDSLIQKRMTENGLEKDADFSSSYEKVSKVFSEIADGIKYSIEKTKDVK